MDICIGSALSAVASKKQLRRLSASLGLHVDDSAKDLVALDESALDEAVSCVFDKANDRERVLARLQELSSGEALGSSHVEEVDPDPTRSVVTTIATAPVGDGCCVECGLASPYVFQLLDVRLCQRCERLPRYGLVSSALAVDAHALDESDLRSLPSMKIHGKRCFLRSQVEALASTTATAARKRRDSAKEWRAQSFKTDAHGKTHKWKDLNTATFQKQRSNHKNRGGHLDADVASECMDLSGLVRADQDRGSPRRI